MLSLVVFLPLAGALALLAVPNKDGSSNGTIRWGALAVSLASFISTLVLWARFDMAVDGFQFVERLSWMPAFGIDYLLGVDGISLMLLVLTGFLTPLALLCSWDSIEEHVRGLEGHLGLVASDRPANSLDAIGWMGPANYDLNPADAAKRLKRGPVSFQFLRTLTCTSTSSDVSMPEPTGSPSPCSAWPSPKNNSAPGWNTGR